MTEDHIIEEQSISLGEIFNIIKKYFWFLAAATILAALAFGVYAFKFAEPQYRAKRSLMVQYKKPTTQGEIIDTLDSQRLIETVKELLVEDPLVMRIAIDNLANHPTHPVVLTERQYKKGIRVDSKTSSLLVNVSFTLTKEEVGDLKPVADFGNVDVLEHIVITIVDSLVEYAEDDNNKISITFKDSIVPLGSHPASYVSPNKTLLVMVGAILGGTLSLIVVFVLEMVTSGFKTKEELEKATKTLVLGVIPEFSTKGEEKWWN